MCASASRRSRSSETNSSQSISPPRVARRYLHLVEIFPQQLYIQHGLFLGQFESIFDMLDHRVASRPGNPDDVESGVPLLEFFGQEILCGLNHFSLLSELHRLKGRAKAVTGSGLNFDKNHHAVV